MWRNLTYHPSQRRTRSTYTSHLRDYSVVISRYWPIGIAPSPIIPSSGKTLPALVRGGLQGRLQTGEIARTVGHNYYVLLHINSLVMYIIRIKSRPILKECVMQRYIIIMLRSPQPPLQSPPTSAGNVLPDEGIPPRTLDRVCAIKNQPTMRIEL
jgi:hypothetical protein